ncbi:radical SAM protein [uncultured Tissierella sp.]|jgi:MoaA/NifB/PqqE/SkfB family radical SAM enzyme|uniref:radical SAM protein n=1 Tax=Tissierella sp. TaxID=41274 RepID=UPI0028052238|nr:radical SAM protein [uncultured Tissierella sp.]MDU5082636.1 radical SAM protein [Bacillota bacterium]
MILDLDKKLKLYINKWVLDRDNFFSDLLYFQIHITNRCGNKCTHCYFHEIPTMGDIDFEECCDFILKSKDLATRLNKKLKVDFIGGDPLLYPQIDALVDFCLTNNVTYGLKCNPNEIVNNWERIESVINNSNDIMLSIDGLEQTNDYIRGKGSFKTALKGIQLLKENNSMVRIHFTASKKNNQEIISLFDFLLNENFIIDDFTWGRYWSASDLENVLTEDDLVILFEKNIDYLNKVFCDKSHFYFNQENRLVPKIFYSFKEHLWIPFFIEHNILIDDVMNQILKKKDCINCTGTKDIYIVDQKFNIFNCRKIDTTYNNIDSFFSGKRHKLSFKNYLCNDCVYVNVCKSCLAIPKVSCIYYKKEVK